MAIDFASSYLLNKTCMNLAEEIEKMQNKGKPTRLAAEIVDLRTRMQRRWTCMYIKKQE